MKRVWLGMTLGMVCGTTYAQDMVFDPRAVAMGGVGVATATPGNAIFHNPAMLASVTNEKQNDFALELPVLGIRIQDDGELATKHLDDLSKAADNLSVAVTNFYNAYQANNVVALHSSAGTTAAALRSFDTQMAAINEKNMTGAMLAGTTVAVPGQQYSFALFLDTKAELGAQFNYADSVMINTLANNLDACNTGTASACTAAQNQFNSNGDITGINSRLNIQGAVAQEFGIAVATHLDVLDGMDVGIVPKMVKLSTYDFSVNAQSNASIKLDQGQVDYNYFNMDLGATKMLDLSGTPIKVGASIKNLIPKSMTTIQGNPVEVKPHATLGAGYTADLYTLGVDLDIIKNTPMLTNTTKESQFLRLGAEFDAWSWAQLRVGYRHDLKGNYTGLPSIGLGLSPFGVHFDLSAAYANNKEVALSLQTGFRF